jgi:hypothetical protein
MFWLTPEAMQVRSVLYYVSPDIMCYFAIMSFFAFVPFERLSKLCFDHPATLAWQLGFSGASLLYSMLLLAANSFNPFIYFRF